MAREAERLGDAQEFGDVGAGLRFGRTVVEVADGLKRVVFMKLLQTEKMNGPTLPHS